MLFIHLWCKQCGFLTFYFQNGDDAFIRKEMHPTHGMHSLSANRKCNKKPPYLFSFSLFCFPHQFLSSPRASFRASPPRLSTCVFFANLPAKWSYVPWQHYKSSQLRSPTWQLVCMQDRCTGSWRKNTLLLCETSTHAYRASALSPWWWLYYRLLVYIWEPLPAHIRCQHYILQLHCTYQVCEDVFLKEIFPSFSPPCHKGQSHEATEIHNVML